VVWRYCHTSGFGSVVWRYRDTSGFGSVVWRYCHTSGFGSVVWHYCHLLESWEWALEFLPYSGPWRCDLAWQLFNWSCLDRMTKMFYPSSKTLFLFLVKKGEKLMAPPLQLLSRG
jgi:hypothetical protein